MNRVKKDSVLETLVLKLLPILKSMYPSPPLMISMLLPSGAEESEVSGVPSAPGTIT